MPCYWSGLRQALTCQNDQLQVTTSVGFDQFFKEKFFVVEKCQILQNAKGNKVVEGGISCEVLGFIANGSSWLVSSFPSLAFCHDERGLPRKTQVRSAPFSRNWVTPKTDRTVMAGYRNKNKNKSRNFFFTTPPKFFGRTLSVEQNFGFLTMDAQKQQRTWNSISGRKVMRNYFCRWLVLVGRPLSEKTICQQTEDQTSVVKGYLKLIFAILKNISSPSIGKNYGEFSTVTDALVFWK